MLPYYGGEAFVLPVIGFRMAPWPASTVVAGLLLLAAAGVLMVVAVRRSGVLDQRDAGDAV